MYLLVGIALEFSLHKILSSGEFPLWIAFPPNLQEANYILLSQYTNDEIDNCKYSIHKPSSVCTNYNKRNSKHM